ncbi:preprotein translocase subunit SecA [Kallipyga gabonensis]|uniref:preprotein translocase subunit SecA n=1 Tax=Kallipyga gabonensis TaxID=1686287 RepID=UPI0006B69B5C|nr:preprotein translocase subunit SecA [Kallipyga gabonensis]
MGLFDFLTKSFSEKEIDRIQPLVNRVLDLEEEMGALSDQALQAKTEEFKKRYREGETLDDLLVEAFAVVREAAWRVLGMKPYPVQIIGGIVLHQGRIAEMKTGEGKTLVSTMPAYLNAIAGKGVHVVTVNDYLATRDSEWMGKVHEFLGLRVGCILQNMSTGDRQAAYKADITYGTNNQFGFDYLRDNMAIYQSGLVQRGLHYAIVDEVDSILVDEARTPLIISGQGDPSTEMYSRADTFIQTLEGRIMDPDEDNINPLDQLLDGAPELETVDYLVDMKRKSANLTEQGNDKAEKFFHVDNISDPSHMELMHYINQALKARTTMKRDIDYVVVDDEVKIVDEFTGRIMEGRRYSDGLHQAIEAKERVPINSESKTLATITFQNFFLMYGKLSGMTGTAMTEKDEFSEIYHLDVIEIPTNRPMIRKDQNDLIFKNEKGKFSAIVDEIRAVHESGQPILVGTVDIETSELISGLLKKVGIKHSVLNAKFHRQEAEIVAQAGRFGTVTIATNMAGRGTDIVLGGNPEWMAKKEMSNKGYSDELIEWADSFRHVEPEDRFPLSTVVTEEEEADAEVQFITGREIMDARALFSQLKEKFSQETKENAEKVREAGGLYILGTSRHESRRIDNQLRGRAGRQGDPGESRFFISLEDKLMYLYGGERMRNMSQSSMFPDDEPIEAGMLTKSIERAQSRVEANNFATRKRVLEYDNVMNVQRKTVYGERKRVLDGENMKDYIKTMIESTVSDAVDSFCPPAVSSESWELEGLFTYLNTLFLPQGILAVTDIREMSQEEFKAKLLEIAFDIYEKKEKELGQENMREMERIVLLQVVDSKWMDHIDAMDQLRQEIAVRSYGQEDPVRAYGNEGFDMFAAMNEAIREDTVRLIYHVVPASSLERTRVATPTREISGDSEEEENKPFVRKGKKIGRNDPCPCGSGKKYKNCHGKNQ